MATIGIVRKEDDGRFVGNLNTLAIRANIRIVPVRDKRSDTAPDYRVQTAEGVDIGVGWTRIGRESQRSYVSLKLDDPTFPNPIYANLGRAAGQDDDEVFSVIWDRG